MPLASASANVLTWPYMEYYKEREKTCVSLWVLDAAIPRAIGHIEVSQQGKWYVLGGHVRIQ